MPHLFQQESLIRHLLRHEPDVAKLKVVLSLVVLYKFEMDHGLSKLT